MRQSYISSEQGGIIFYYLAGSEMLLNAEQDRRKLSFSEQDGTKLHSRSKIERNSDSN